MKLSTKSRYGVRAVYEIAKNYNIRPTKRKEIVKLQNLDDSYIENILILLKNAQVINTMRGANGGYVLAADPTSITVLDLVTILDGPVDPVDCLTSKGDCPHSKRCPTQRVWDELRKAIEQVLGNYTMQDLIYENRNAELFDYSI